MKCTLTLLMSLTVLGASVDALADDAGLRREQAIATLVQSGIKVDRNEAQAQPPVTRIFFGCHRAPGALVHELQHIPEVEILNLRLNEQVTAADLKGLRALVNLRELVIHHCPVNDESLGFLKPMVHLRELRFAQTAVSDNGLQNIAALKKLEIVQLHGKAVTDRGLAELEAMPSLKKLILSQTSVTDERIARLQATLPNVQIRRF